MAIDLADGAFKILNDREVTDENKRLIEEFGTPGLILANQRIWADTIDSDPAQAVIDGTAQLETLSVLSEDVSVPNQEAWRASNDNWIPESFGAGYALQLFDGSDNPITLASQINEGIRFNFKTGILTIDGNAGAFTQPFKITAYRYVGAFGITAGGPSNTFTEDATSIAGGTGSSLGPGDGVALGSNVAGVQGATTIGHDAQGSVDSITLGRDADNSGGSGSILIGSSSTMTGNNTIAIGDGVTASAGSGMVFGRTATLDSLATGSIVLGRDAYCNAPNAIVLGRSAAVGAAGDSAVLIGFGGNCGAFGVAIGAGADAGSEGIAIGRDASNTASSNIRHTCLGYEAQSLGTSTNCVLVGYQAQVTDSPISVVIGASANIADGNEVGANVAVGTSIALTGIHERGVYIGVNAASSGAVDSVGIGQSVDINADQAITIGADASCSGDESTIVGRSGACGATQSVGVGMSVSVQSGADQSVAVGHSSVVPGFARSQSIGYNCRSGGDDTIAIGANINYQTTITESIGIGNSCVPFNGQSVTIGHAAQSLGGTIAPDGAVTIGHNAVGTSNTQGPCVVIGHDAVGQDGSVVIGNSTNGGGGVTSRNVVIGNSISVADDSGTSVVIGQGSVILAGGNNVVVGRGASVGSTGNRCTVVGAAASADGFFGGTAVGDSAVVLAQGTVVGRLAVSTGTQTAMVGSNTSGAFGACVLGSGSSAGQQTVAIGLNINAATSVQTVAIGTSITSVSGSVGIGTTVNCSGGSTVVIGNNSQATSNFSVSVGRAVVSSGVTTVGIGDTISITADRAIAIGPSTTVSHADAGAMGSGAASTAAGRMSFNGAMTELEMDGGMGVFGSTPPAAQPSVTGSRGGNAALASLLTALASYGLIVDNTTA